MDKREELMSTFWKNRGSLLADFLIAKALHEDSEALREHREKTKDLYENAARRYYNKHGTNGEF